MAKRGNSPDALLERLTLLRQVSSSPEFLAELKKALSHSSPVVVTRGAELACRYNKSELVDDLIAAFNRCLSGAVADDQHVAHTAIVRAMIDLSATTSAAEDVYLAGTQIIGSRVPPGSPNDFAADLRASSAFGLVVSRHPDAQKICCDLLTDRSPIVQSGAAKALAAGGYPAAPLLLRLMIRIGHAIPDVIADCATEVVALDPVGSSDVVATLLSHADDGVRATAAVALGSPRVPNALEFLRTAYRKESEPQVQEAILAAAVATRAPAAVDWMVGLADSESGLKAATVIRSLSPYRLDDSLKHRLGAIVTSRKDSRLAEAFAAAFGGT